MSFIVVAGRDGAEVMEDLLRVAPFLGQNLSGPFDRDFPIHRKNCFFLDYLRTFVTHRYLIVITLNIHFK